MVKQSGYFGAAVSPHFSETRPDAASPDAAMPDAPGWLLPLGTPARAKIRPRLGHIDFLNCFPLLWGLGKVGSLLSIELTRDTPDNLGRALVAGDLDISPISAYEFLRHADDLVVLPDIAIGSDGAVMSCLILSRVPQEELTGARVALSSISRTSVRLAELMLGELLGVKAEYFVSSTDLDTMMRQAQAAVLIGDVALHAAVYDAPRLGLHVYDLGQMWRDWTGLPFVFAVMAARREFVEREPELVRRVHADLLAARDLSLLEIEAICEQLAPWEEFDAQTLRRYYCSALKFDFGDRQLAGLAEFARRTGGADSGFPPDVRIQLLEPL